MRATFRRYSRSWVVHAIIVAIAILVGMIVALFARPTRSRESVRNFATTSADSPAFAAANFRD